MLTNLKRPPFSIPTHPDNRTLATCKPMDAHTSVCISEAKEAYLVYKKSLGDLKLGLYALSPLDRTQLPVLIVHSSCRMDAASVKKVKKWNPSRKDLNAFC